MARHRGKDNLVKLSWRNLCGGIFDASRRHATRSRAATQPRLGVEELETRLVPTVTWQGGAVLTAPDVQPLYLGSDWTSSRYSNQVNSLNGFLSYIVKSSYLPMLGNTGYNFTGTAIGKGSYEPGKIDTTDKIEQSQVLTDLHIQQYVQNEITNHTLKPPNSQNLYVVFVEDNVVVEHQDVNSNGTGRILGSFYGYHSAFGGKDAFGKAADIHYVVICYPGGTVKNQNSLTWLTTNGSLTVVTSHELAEAATDPNIGYKTLGWNDNDDGNEGEVGDIVKGQTVYLGGYAVQKIADQNDQAMVPVGATALKPVTFVLGSDHVLREFTASGPPKIIDTGVVALSDQEIDDNGQAMVDYLKTGGNAYEYHAYDASKIYFGSGIKSAVAGDGVSYLLYSDNTLKEYRDASYHTGASFIYLDTLTSAATLSAGTDREGVNAVVVLSSEGGASEYSDSTGWTSINAGTKPIVSISAGQQGIVAYVNSAGDAYEWVQGFGNTPSRTSQISSKVKQITAGSDQNGRTALDLLFSDGSLREFDDGQLSKVVATGVQSISKARDGLVDLIFSHGVCKELTACDLGPQIGSGAIAAG
jgi:hypothetical protein